MGKQPKTSLHIVQRPTNWCLPDKAFQAYVRSKIDAHNDGTSVITTTIQLMEFAKQKYNNELLEDTAWISKDKTEQSHLHQMEAKAARTKAR